MLPAGKPPAEVSSAPSVNEAGAVAVVASHAPAPGEPQPPPTGGFGVARIDTVWAGRPGALRRVLSGGDPAPGLPAGWRVARLDGVTGSAGPVVGRDGTLALPGVAADPAPEIGATPVTALWAATGGKVVLVAATRRPVPWAGGERPLFSIDGRSMAVDDAGGVWFDGQIGTPGKLTPAAWRFAGGKLERVWAEGEPLPIAGLPPGVRYALAPTAIGPPATALGRDGRLLAVASVDGQGGGGATAIVCYAPGRGWGVVARAGAAVDGIAKLPPVAWVGPPSRDGRFLFKAEGDRQLYRGTLPAEE